ncbi:MAG: PEP-CTERM sorting domain-containing protein [Armatimonadetes bacterium]|nr:PEP-CTERM sorting domain-containing protein [Armatimonadota bacterium]
MISLNLRLISVSLAVAFASSLLAVGPTSMLYAVNDLEFGPNTGLDRIQGASYASGNTGNTNDYAIAVWGDVRTCGYYSGATGSRFDLNGNPLPGGPYANTYAADPIYDGTSDGTYNYGVGRYGGGLFRYDRNWLNPTTLWVDNNMPDHSGITMNVSDGSFWLSQYGGIGLIEHFSGSGTLLGSFVSGIRGIVGLAYDSADGTLWMNNEFAPGTIYQFDQVGNFLQQTSYGTNGVKMYGMEFNEATVTPEPATMGALALGVLGVLRRRRRS